MISGDLFQEYYKSKNDFKNPGTLFPSVPGFDIIGKTKRRKAAKQERGT
jgi:hypothetical protein